MNTVVLFWIANARTPSFYRVTAVTRVIPDHSVKGPVPSFAVEAATDIRAFMDELPLLVSVLCRRERSKILS